MFSIFHLSFVIDPYGVLAMLGFLVFLFYIIYNYLNATGNSNGRHFVKRSNYPEQIRSEASASVSSSTSLIHDEVLVDIHKTLLTSIDNFDRMNV